ncbi:FGGY family carbohydrate kinase [Actinocorallia aurea]
MSGIDGVVIGLDVGTTAVKAVAFGPGDRRHAVVRESGGGVTQDPERLAADVIVALGECATAVRGERVLAVAVGTAMHGLLALDAAARPLTPLLTWADDRAAAQAWRLHRSGQAAELHRASGTPVHPMAPLAKLLWFREEDRDLWSRTRWWAGLKDFVLMRLTGRLVTELSSASGTGLLCLAARGWNHGALRVAGIGEEHLPPILPTTALLELSAQAARATGLPAGTPVVAGAGDGPLGNLGTGAMARGVAGLSLGTSGAVRTVLPEPFADAEGRLFSYALTDEAWVVGAAVSNGGSVVRWAGELLAADLPPGEVRDTALLELAERVPPGADGLVMLPYLLPERAPLWQPELSGGYAGLTHRHSRGHLVRAAIEGVALRLAEIVEDLERVGPISSVRATGGAFRAPLWRRVVAAMVDRPTAFVSAAEGTALGAAALGLHALGHAPELASAPLLLGPCQDAVEPVGADPGTREHYRRHRARHRSLRLSAM